MRKNQKMAENIFKSFKKLPFDTQKVIYEVYENTTRTGDFTLSKQNNFDSNYLNQFAEDLSEAIKLDYINSEIAGYGVYRFKPSEQVYLAAKYAPEIFDDVMNYINQL